MQSTHILVSVKHRPVQNKLSSNYCLSPKYPVPKTQPTNLPAQLSFHRVPLIALKIKDKSQYCVRHSLSMSINVSAFVLSIEYTHHTHTTQPWLDRPPREKKALTKRTANGRVNVHTFSGVTWSKNLRSEKAIKTKTVFV